MPSSTDTPPPEADIGLEPRISCVGADPVRWTSSSPARSSRRRARDDHAAGPTGRIFTYGCGLGVRIDRGETVLSHTGAIEGFFAFNTFVPRTRSAVVLLVNDTRAEVADLHQAIVGLVLQRPTEIPVVPGPTPEDTTRLLVRQLQRGVLDRSKPATISTATSTTRASPLAARLRALGEPTVTLVDRHERGAMEVTTLELTFPKQTLTVTMFRSPLGKIHQFLLRPA
jgi:hypothetical protein